MSTEQGGTPQPTTEGNDNPSVQPNEAGNVSDTAQVAAGQETNDPFVPIIASANASIEERLAIFQQNNAAYNERMEKALAEERRRLDEVSISLQNLEVSSRQTQGHW